MGKGNAVWGIDIGQSALKALRCSLDSDGRTLVAEAFDFIEYPKILSQPDAEPEKLIRDALKQFLSRNSVRGDKVAISVSGQSGLARFIKLPPVEAKKIPDIVKYEAKQQIPFALEDVIWDYEPLPGTKAAGGTSLETEVGLFAMKREHVFRAIKPLDEAGVEIDIIQLAPLCIYNAVTYGVLKDLPEPSQYDEDNPPDSVVVLSMGTETTDLVVTNGFRVWQRSIPLGGNHFTKQLTKELKLTFAKAEQLKRTAREAENAKTIFQAMRPVFNDLVTEVQRSIGYYQNLERDAKIGGIVVLGNTIKLPGLQQFLSKNLGYEINRIQSFDHLSGSSVLSAAAFEENIPSFGVCYGLVIQGLGKSRLSTNLVPRELVVARNIRRKKPWALAAVSVVLAGLCFNYLFHWKRWYSAHPDHYKSAFSQVDRVTSTSTQFISNDEKQLATLAQLKALGDEVVGNAEGRLLMLELMKVVNDALPKMEDESQHFQLEFDERPLVYIEHFESKYYEDLGEWWNESVQQRYVEGQQTTDEEGAAPADAAAGTAADASGAPDQAGGTSPTPDNAAAGTAAAGTGAAGTAPAGDAAASTGAEPAAADSSSRSMADGSGLTGTSAEGGPKGRGWIIELKGFHYHNSRKVPPSNQGAQYIRNTIMRSLQSDHKIMLPAGPGKPLREFTIRQLGISYPIVAVDKPVAGKKINNPDYFKPELDDLATDEDTGEGPQLTPEEKKRLEALKKKAEDPKNWKDKTIPMYTFTIQFCWQEQRISQRNESAQSSEKTGETDQGA